MKEKQITKENYSDSRRKGSNSLDVKLIAPKLLSQIDYGNTVSFVKYDITITFYSTRPKIIVRAH